MSLRGPSVKSHAIVLSLVPFQEKHLIVQFYTLESGKISALAMNARNSQKRFGAALQVGHYVMANLTKTSGADNKMWRLDSVDLKDSFDHLRRSLESIESLSFYLSLVRDLCLDSNPDPEIFICLGRILRDSKNLDFKKHANWSRAALWSWWAHHHGFGDMTDPIQDALELNHMEEVWHNILARDQPHWSQLFQFFCESIDQDLTNDIEQKMYIEWIQASGIHWKHFESSNEMVK